MQRVIKGTASAWLKVASLESCYFDRPSLGMVWPFNIKDNLPAYLSNVMDVVQISHFNMHWTRAGVLSSSNIMKFRNVLD